MAISENRKYTAEEFFKLEAETDERYELINGEIVDLATPTITHQRIAGEIYVEFKNYIRHKGGKCEPFISPLEVKLNDDNVVQPDVFVICDPDKLSNDKRVYGVPDLVVEVVSTNRRDDLVRKFGIYESVGVREYWVVDPKNKRTIVYLFEDDYSINIHTFDQPIPVGIYDGELTITIGDML